MVKELIKIGRLNNHAEYNIYRETLSMIRDDYISNIIFNQRNNIKKTLIKIDETKVIEINFVQYSPLKHGTWEFWTYDGYTYCISKYYLKHHKLHTKSSPLYYRDGKMQHNWSTLDDEIFFFSEKRRNDYIYLAFKVESPIKINIKDL
ncbi:hypothetical protein LCGC14_0175520 [marine sediment metagenome]|uniref:Uncharacterized protein n=1 Tax=marine sediment metagenome TaxID=412755 RepID=A0A0F9XTQ4_9ZZZZ